MKLKLNVLAVRYACAVIGARWQAENRQLTAS